MITTTTIISSKDDLERRKIIKSLASHYPTITLSQENIAAFARALASVPIEKLQQIADYWADTQAKFPESPAELKIKLQQKNELNVIGHEKTEKDRIEEQKASKCPFCNEMGWRYFMQEGKRTARKCTHKKSVESQFHGAIKGKTPGLEPTPMPFKIKEIIAQGVKKVDWK